MNQSIEIDILPPLPHVHIHVHVHLLYPLFRIPFYIPFVFSYWEAARALHLHRILSAAAVFNLSFPPKRTLFLFFLRPLFYGRPGGKTKARENKKSLGKVVS